MAIFPNTATKAVRNFKTIMKNHLYSNSVLLHYVLYTFLRLETFNFINTLRSGGEKRVLQSYLEKTSHKLISNKTIVKNIKNSGSRDGTRVKSCSREEARDHDPFLACISKKLKIVKKYYKNTYYTIEYYRHKCVIRGIMDSRLEICIVKIIGFFCSVKFSINYDLRRQIIIYRKF